MNIVIRADGSLKIGLGHIYRCLTISEYFQKVFPDINISFITNSRPEVRKKLLKNYECIDPSDNKKVSNLVKNSDIFISDMLNTSNNYISKIKQLNPLIRVICIDNNTELKPINSSDIVFNANVFNRGDLLIENTYYYMGPDYMILREYFLVDRIRPSKDMVNSVFVSFGGSDEKGFTVNVLKSLKNLKNSFQINVITGPLFQFTEELLKMATEDDRIKVLSEPEDICELMYDADLAIVAGGITLYETCSLGVPSLVIPQVEHQADIAYQFAKNGACINLGFNPSAANIKSNLEMLISNKRSREKISLKGRNFVDGKGLKRFIEIVTDDLNAKTI